jgi:hypothetical protein
MIPDVICELDKAIYFQPLPDIYGRIGISIVEVNSKLSLNLEKILPILSNQIVIIIDNFETHNRLRISKVNEEREKLRSLIFPPFHMI